MTNPNLFKNIEEASVESLEQRWDSLDISQPLLAALIKEFKFDKMTPVQAATIPLMLQGKDVIVQAKTGSGKTLAFLVPLIENLLRLDKSSEVDPTDILVIILSPTRELASQIHQELRKLLRNPLLPDGRHFVSHLLVGGNSVAADIDKYTKYGGNLIVATPGRLSTIMEMRDNKFSVCVRRKLAFLVFDEADQLLSFGFEKNLSSILAYLPKQRRTSLFSATQTSEVEELAKSGLRNPIRINLNQANEQSGKRRSQATATQFDSSKSLPMPDKLVNFYHVCDSYSHKLAAVCQLIQTDEFKKVIVFISTCAQIDYFYMCLNRLLDDKKRTPILKLHRRLKNKRKSVFKRFKDSKRCVLLVTDVLSRGIDVPDISCVIHLDLPETPECYVHRSGRSGHQIELSGISLLLLEQHEEDYVEMCRRRGIVLRPMKSLRSSCEQVEEMSAKVRDCFKSAIKGASDKDDEYLLLAKQAFVSYIRFYSSKLCLRQLLFPKLPVDQLVASYGLERAPKMPELKSLRRKT